MSFFGKFSGKKLLNSYKNAIIATPPGRFYINEIDKEGKECTAFLWMLIL